MLKYFSFALALLVASVYASTSGTLAPSVNTCNAFSCPIDKQCLECQDGNIGCFDLSFHSYTCCGCSFGACIACPRNQVCVPRGTSYGCEHVTITLSAGAIVGIVFGIIACIFALIVCIICVRRRRTYATVDVVPTYSTTYHPPPVVVTTTPHHHHHGHHHGPAVGFQAGGGAAVGYQAGSGAAVGYQAGTGAAVGYQAN